MLPSVTSLMHTAWCKHGHGHKQPHLASQPLLACLLLGKELIDELTPLFPRGTEHWASEMAPAVKNPPEQAEDIRDMCLTPGSGRSLEEGTATHSSILAWKIPWTEEPGGLQSKSRKETQLKWLSKHACMKKISAFFWTLKTIFLSLKWSLLGVDSSS